MSHYAPLLNFLKNSPTAYHAVEQISIQLTQAGFFPLALDKPWILEKEHHYFVVKNGSLAAFKIPKTIEKASLIASHTDSPTFKLKPAAEFVQEGYRLLGLEIYGGPLITSWLNRDLAIAGRVLYRNNQGAIQESLITLEETLVTIPQLAIHLDRKVNDEGLLLNKQDHLQALIGPDQGTPFLLPALQKKLPIQELLAHDLFLYPVEGPRILGDNHLLASYRLDSLASVHAATTAFATNSPSRSCLQGLFLTNHEEVGSESSVGACSSWVSSLLERLCLSLHKDRRFFLELLESTSCLSVDLGHALHPNYATRHDPHHKPLLGSGVLIKTNAQQKYATDIACVKKVLEITHTHQIPIQWINGRNEIPSGSTVGPIHSAHLGVPTLDIGIGQLSMHSARELISLNDYESLTSLLQAWIQ